MVIVLQGNVVTDKSIECNFKFMKHLRYIAMLFALFIWGSFQIVLAQNFYYGKNRIQYDSFQWRYVQSEHFDVYYYDSKNYYLARFSAQAAEAAYRQIAQDFGHQISNRIRIIVYDSDNDFVQTNVVALPDDSDNILGVTDLYKNRVTLWFRNNWEDYRQTLHHELIHAVINDMFYGGSIQSIIQNNIQLVIPLWFNEGMAEFSSVGMTTQADEYMAHAVMLNAVPPINQIYGYFNYAGGMSIWNFIVDEYGREKIQEIFQRVKTTRSVDSGFRQSLGLSVDELSERWHKWLKKRYWPEIERRDMIDEIAQPITTRELSGSWNTSPSISPAGDRIALISNKRGFMDVVVVDANTGKPVKTLIKGQDNVNFEDLNLINPGLAWSPDAQTIALSAKSKGSDAITLVNYSNGDFKKIAFPGIDMIGSVSWSPDGDWLSFEATSGAYSDIYIYNLKTTEFINITNDVFSDLNPTWAPDSKTLFFASDRGSNLEINRFGEAEYNVLLNPDLGQLDLYSLNLESKRFERLTNTPGWTEKSPLITETGKLLYLSDQNGITNVYLMDLASRISNPVTNVMIGIQQMSINRDGTRLAVNSFNSGYMDVFVIKSPATMLKEGPLEPNQWASARTKKTRYDRVPGLAFAREMFGEKEQPILYSQFINRFLERDKIGASVVDTSATVAKEIDFRNYVFGQAFEKVKEEKEIVNTFEVDDNMTEDGLYRPRPYRLRFSPDISYSGAGISTGYGVNGLYQLELSDLLGDHVFSVATNLVLDLRNSNYIIGYGYYKNRWNINVNYYHSAVTFYSLSSFSGSLSQVRYRTYGLNGIYSYPFDKFTRLDLSTSLLTVTQDVNDLDALGRFENEAKTFLYPSATITRDRTRPGFMTPSGGRRMALSVSGSPAVGKDMLSFVSAMTDLRQYVGLGYTYSLAFRFSGGASTGRDAQTYFLGGVQNWINYRWDNNSIPDYQLSDIIFTQPALPMRGYNYNTLYGNYYGLVNAEFRFPLVAALLPGPIPILPLYNVTGVAFIDAGTAWGLADPNNPTQNSSLDFRLTKTLNQNGFVTRDGDVLLGAGFGLRTIFLGFPFRYDVGWARERDGFVRRPLHYFSIGLDF
jgi:Tol biopolymer transport system component